MQLKEKLELNKINQKLEFLVRTYRQDLQPIKEAKSVATVDRQDLLSIKNRKFEATNYQPYLPPIKEHKSALATLLKITFIYFPLGLIFFVFFIFPAPFMCRVHKPKQPEATQYLSLINKGQQAYYAENSTFSNSFNALGVGIKTQTTDYKYSISATKNAAFSYAIPLKETKNLRSYVGAVSLVTAGEARTTQSILCEAKSFGNTKLANPIVENGALICAPGTNLVAK